MSKSSKSPRPPKHPAAHLGVDRGYRARIAPRPGEHAFRIMVGETDLFVTARAEPAAPLPPGPDGTPFPDLQAALAARVHALRGDLTAYIQFHPDFLHSFDPVPVPDS
ncbi:MAG: hypothetical protein AB7D57_08670, partial [Desulfovibrionaceae bacterium]